MDGLYLGAIPAALWLLLFGLSIAALLASIQGALWAHLYLAGRAGNDELPSRDAYLARRALEAASAPASPAAEKAST